jgi:hypothetical protein
VSSSRLTDQIATWAEIGLDLYRMGDNATYDVTIAVDPQQGPLVLVLLWMPSLIVGEQMQVVGAMPHPASVTEEQVIAFVREGLEAMRSQRIQQAAQGPQVGHSTLLVPGGR